MKPPTYAKAKKSGPGGVEPSADAWDDQKAAWLVGKYALVGVAWTEKGAERAEQYHGRIVSADPEVGISVECEGTWKGETFVIPPSTDFVQPAQPGEYRLRTTGETIVNPDVLTTWRIEEGTSS